MKSWLAAAPALFLLVVLTGWPSSQPDTGTPTERPLSLTKIPVKNSSHWTGLTIIFNPDDPWSVFEADLQIARNWNAPCIQIQVSYFTRDRQSSKFPVYDRRSPDDEILLRALNLARQQTPLLVLHPILLIQDPDSPHWRGQYQPLFPDQWWNHYQQWMTRMALVAESSGVHLFMAGSELTSLQNESDRWSRTIRAIRQVYSGQLGYSANWDAWQQVPFHDELDLLALNGYFPLDWENASRTFPSTKADLRSRLLPHLSAMQRWTQEHQTPLLFSEVGYPAHSTDLSRPWFSPKVDSQIDGRLQKEALTAFLDVFGRSGTHCGILFYALHGHDPEVPSGYTPFLRETQGLWIRTFSESSQP